ncbi:MAG: asparagine synthetase B family protein [bacterium]
MSRIAGIIHTGDTDYRSTRLHKMLAASRFNDDWQMDSRSTGNATIGWCGWQGSNCTWSHGVIAAIDGFVYNRAELAGADSDAELVAGLYARHGFENAIERINGDFAIALYDPQSDTLWLARDRFGLKPLYYASTPALFAFASRPSALFSLPDMSCEVNHRYAALFAASHYRYFDNDPEASPYAEINQLPAANLLCLKNNRYSKKAYWHFKDLPDFEKPEAELAEAYRELLTDAVSIRLAAAQRPAFTLSGGMDSSSVLASAVQKTGAKQHAFSTVYADKTYDESDEIKSMLDATVEQWHPVSIGIPDIFQIVPKMIAVHDEPVATATWLSHFLLCETVADEGFGGLFGGLGGDELNAGEYEYFFYHFADLRLAGEEEQLEQEVQKWVKYHDHPIFRKSFKVVEDAFSRLVDFAAPGRCLPDRNRLQRYLSALNPEYCDLSAFEPAMEHPFSSYLKNRTYHDLTRETAPPCLRAEDRQTMAFGLDNFLPFFDHRLVEFMFRVPGTMKFRKGVTKRLLREAMRDLLPEETRTRIKKTGWNAPAHVWFSGSGRSKLLDMVQSQRFKERGIYRVQEVVRIIDEHHDIVTNKLPRDNHMMFLWQLVNLELWLSQLDKIKAKFVDADSALRSA